jgi:hypothetical protein
MQALENRDKLLPTMIESIGGFLQRNLIVLLAVVLVPMKLVILRLCGDGEAQRAAFLSIPEDLVYVSLGLVLGDFATAGGAFRRHFGHSPHLPMDMVVTVMFGLGVAVGVHVLAKWTNDHVNSWRAASNVRLRGSSPIPFQAELELHPADSNIRMIQVRHVALASMLFLLQLVAIIKWIVWIARVLAS